MTRTVLITPRFPPQCCGLGDYAAQLARTLTARGEDVIVFTRPSPGPRPQGMQVLELPLRGWRDLPQTVRAILGAQASRVQLEYSNYGWSRWGFAFWLNALVAALRMRGLPVDIAFHEVPLRFSQHPLQAGIAVVQRIHFWLLACCAHHVMTNTPERVGMLRRWLPWRRTSVHYRPNSSTIPVEPISAAERTDLHASHGADAGTLVVALFGTFHADKNHGAVLEAVAGWQGSRRFQLWLLGNWQDANPSHIARLRERAKKLGLEPTLVWGGPMTAKEISAHLQAADIFALPQPDGHLTRSSAFMAAAAHGLPVIAVRNAENQTEFAHGQDVWLIGRSAAQDFISALETLAADAGLRSSLGRNLKTLYEQKFDWANVGVPSAAPAEAAPVVGELVQPAAGKEV